MLLIESFLLGKEVISIIPREIEKEWAPPGLLENIGNNEEETPKLFSEDDNQKVEEAETQNEKLFNQTTLDDEEFEIPAFLRKQKF